MLGGRAVFQGRHASLARLEELGDAIRAQVLENGQDFHMKDIVEVMIEDFDTRWGDGTNINNYTLRTNGTNKGQPCGYTKGQVLCFTLDPRITTLPQVEVDQEEVVCHVLDVRCQQLMLDDQRERDRSVHVPEQTSLTDSTHTPPISQITNPLGCKKTSKIVPAPVTASSQASVDVNILSKQVSPRNIYILRPLECTYY